MRFLRALALVVSVFVMQAAPAFAAVVPTCTITLSSYNISLGGSITIKWTSTNADGGAITNVGNVGPSGSKNIIPTRTTTYIGSFTGAGGTANCQATVTIGGAGGMNNVNDFGQLYDSNGQPFTTQLYYANGQSFNIQNYNPNGQSFSPQLYKSDGTPFTSQLYDSNGKPYNIGGIQNFTRPYDSGVQNTAQTQPSPQTSVAPTNTAGGGVGALVPCIGLNCQLCSVAKLSQNLINFMVGLSIPLAAALLAYAGILYYTSGVGGEANIKKAKAILRTMGIGFLIIIGAFLGVQTVLKVMLAPGYYQSWNNIQCLTTPRLGTPGNTKTITDFLNLLPFLNTNAPTTVGVSGSGGQTIPNPAALYSCDSGWDLVGTQCTSRTTGDTVNANFNLDGYVTDPIARSLLETNGIKVVSSGNCSDKYNPTCTSLDGVSLGVIENIIKLKQDSGSSIVISGGTEQGIHVSSAQNNGTSVDIKFADPTLNSNPAAINNLIQTVQSQGGCLVWETALGVACPAGVTKCLAGTGTGYHGSYYINPGASPSCK